MMMMYSPGDTSNSQFHLALRTDYDCYRKTFCSMKCLFTYT